MPVDKTIFRPSDIRVNCGYSGKAREGLGWVAQTAVEGVIEHMCEAAAAVKPGVT